MIMTGTSRNRKTHYPKSDCPARPYHLWNATENKTVRYRYYSDPKRAHMGALYEVRWAKHVGTTIDVYNARSGHLLGQYTLGVNAINYRGPKMEIVPAANKEAA